MLTDNEQVAIKSLIVFHRILRESDASFKEELMQISRRGHIFLISNFKDDSSPLGNLILHFTFSFFFLQSITLLFNPFMCKSHNILEDQKRRFGHNFWDFCWKCKVMRSTLHLTCQNTCFKTASYFKFRQLWDQGWTN